ncbi:MAG: hypothetical protein K2N06_05440 [Oscillospiraceae bacterium]|nr:hypothetical protein [Oscillospiraceae bacterium]
MEIIEQGTHIGSGETKKFECYNCDCVFKAYENEYVKAWHLGQSREGITAECACPKCGKTAFSHE